ncbi:hypothetical protein F4779DRAFT_620564 [Xylariaceae sp. FL0662B]|nr:hypothetical protein F4779DRAFT_620564 [Xylariaceae sp. FL0662B]
MPWLMLASLLLALPIPNVARAGFTAFRDSKCTKPLEICSDGEVVANNTLLIDKSIKDQAGGHAYKNMEFPNATTSSTQDNVGASNVYWKMDDPDVGCQYALLKDNREGWQVINPLAGTLILRANKEGCYYSSLDAFVDLITTFCCGMDDCSHMDIDYNNGDVQSDLDPESAGDLPNCTITPPGTPFYTSGLQQSMTQPTHCDVGITCPHSVSTTRYVYSAITHQTEQSWTSENGRELSLKTGIEFLAQFDVTASLTVSLAKSFSKTTGITLTNATSVATTHPGAQQIGTTAFFSFTPKYKCWHTSANCGKDIDGNDIVIPEFMFCQPQRVGADLHSANSGHYDMVYISP